MHDVDELIQWRSLYLLDPPAYSKEFERLAAAVS